MSSQEEFISVLFNLGTWFIFFFLSSAVNIDGLPISLKLLSRGQSSALLVTEDSINIFPLKFMFAKEYPKKTPTKTPITNNINALCCTKRLIFEYPIDTNVLLPANYPRYFDVKNRKIHVKIKVTVYILVDFVSFTM
jgi:hypothetical protein